MVRHVLRLHREKDPPIQQCTGCQKTAGERWGGRIRHGKVHSKKTRKRWVSAGMNPAVTVKDGYIVSPADPRGTGGPKSKAVSTPVPVANWTLATRALESGLRPHDDRPLTDREPFAPS